MNTSVQKANKIRSFWNEKAQENPYWYISSYGTYGSDRNLEEFWASGLSIWQELKASMGYTCKGAHEVIEIGCGIGRVTKAIAKDASHVQAFDISGEMLNIARQLELTNVTFRLAEGFDLRAVNDASADLVLAYCVFQHLPSLNALRSYVSEMVRVVKPGGAIAFTLTARDWKCYLLPLLRFRAYMRERVNGNGPSGIYRKEWIGIRPRRRTVLNICSIPLSCVTLSGDRWLFFGRL